MIKNNGRGDNTLHTREKSQISIRNHKFEKNWTGDEGFSKFFFYHRLHEGHGGTTWKPTVGPHGGPRCDHTKAHGGTTWRSMVGIHEGPQWDYVNAHGGTAWRPMVGLHQGPWWDYKRIMSVATTAWLVELHTTCTPDHFLQNGSAQELGFIIQVWLKYDGHDYEHCVNYIVDH